jgi:ribokinase
LSIDDARPTVIVVGSANIDMNFQLPRLPMAGETVIGGEVTRLVGGKGANQASTAARLGAKTFLVGRVGDDEDGDRVRSELNDFGVDTTHLLVNPHVATGLAAVLIGKNGENLIGVASGANSALSGREVTDSLDAISAKTAVVLACLEIPMDAVRAAAVAAAEHGYPFVLNPAPALDLPPDLLRHVDVLTPNEHEMPFLGYQTPAAILELGTGAVAVTRGADGVHLHVANNEWQHLPAFPVAVVDTTGAGDAFNGALAWALASGYELPTAVRLASAAGALATQGIGARTCLPTAAEVKELALRGDGIHTE